jgi:hypothetical protein
MNLYAWALYEEGLIQEPTAWLRYNLFVKNLSTPQVKVVQVERTKEAIYRFYEDQIVPMYKPMALAATRCFKWSEVDSAMKQGNAKNACEKYGGCPYLDICLGKVSVDTYKERFNKSSLEDHKKGQADVLSSLLNNNKAPDGEKESTMEGGLLERLKKNAAAPAAPEAAAPAAPEKKIAPWAYEGCPVCSEGNTPGIHAAEPCNICVAFTDKIKASGNNPNQPVLADFDVTISEDGIVTWSGKVTEVAVEAAPVEEAATVTESTKSLGGTTFQEADPATKVAPLENEKTPEEAPPTAVIPPAKNPDEPLNTVNPLSVKDPKEFNQERGGFIVSYGRIQSRKRAGKKLGDSSCIVAPAELLEHIASGLLTVANMNGAQAKEWYDIDYFKRRDLIVRNAKEISDIAGNSMIDASNLITGSDEEILISAIERYAVLVCGSLK